MASGIYEKWKQNLLSSSTNSNSTLNGTGTIGVYAALIDRDTGYTDGILNFSTNQYYSEIASYIQGTPVELTGKTFTNGVFDANDAVFTNVSGNTIEAVLIYRRNTSSNNTWELVALIDSEDLSPASVTPDGTVTIMWNNSGIFKL